MGDRNSETRVHVTDKPGRVTPGEENLRQDQFRDIYGRTVKKGDAEKCKELRTIPEEE